MADEQKGRCVGCGYLSWRRHNDDTSPFFEVTSDRRASGERPQAGETADVSPAPYCYHGIPIHTEYQQVRSGGEADKRKAFLTVIGNPRQCPLYFPYQPGKNPDAHEQMETEQANKNAEVEAAKESADQAHAREMAKLIFQWKNDRRAEASRRVDETIRHERAMELDRQRDNRWKVWDVVRWVVAGVGAVGMFFLGQCAQPQKQNAATPPSQQTDR